MYVSPPITTLCRVYGLRQHDLTPLTCNLLEESAKQNKKTESGGVSSSGICSITEPQQLGDPLHYRVSAARGSAPLQSQYSRDLSPGARAAQDARIAFSHTTHLQYLDGSDALITTAEEDAPA
ncbi:hypothetical protein NDU88_002543 [Pleurodeles waltl]|uniref:Uncharacterized protein n=1 Tax=Pleurodeles waltl TaxID=8319 RepID=A0AAV7WPV1_PLEWA|nr:hypothetical protein NDU88_002543 [Pleurodeles waltl]